MPHTARSLTPVQILAREICWVGFSKEGRKGKTKNAYWNSLPPLSRLAYEQEAGRFAWLADRINFHLVDKVIADSKVRKR